MLVSKLDYLKKNEISTRVWVKGTPKSAQNKFSKSLFKSRKLCSEERIISKLEIWKLDEI